MMSPEAFQILVIEDDADARANLRDILALDDYVIEMAATAEVVLARSASDWGRFSAIILDRQLPDTRADELLPKLRRLAPNAAVIVVTGHSDLEGVISALRQGAADYLLKPINPDLLRASLERLTERRRLALAKERSESAFRNLVEAANCMTVICRPDRSIVYFSPFAERLTGRAAHEVVGQDFFRLFLPESTRETVVSAHELASSGQQIDGYETEIVCRDGSRRTVLWNVRLLPGYDDGPAVLGLGQDITGLKQAQLRALQSERLAAIGQMVAGLAHESRNALQRSQACLEMLALVVKDRPEALDLIARLQLAQDDLYHLYEDVRGYAAPIVLDRRPCDLATIWREAWSHLGDTRNGKEASLGETLDGVDLVCMGDPFRLAQVFRNVFENALAMGKSPVEVQIRAERTVCDGRPAIRLVIRDNGPGIAPERRRDVFEPFFTTKAKGTGLGMAITRRIVEAHGGRITIADEPPPGAKFLITLPRGAS